MGQGGSRTCLSHLGLLLTVGLWSYLFRSSMNRPGHVSSITVAACGGNSSGIKVAVVSHLAGSLARVLLGSPVLDFWPHFLAWWPMGEEVELRLVSLEFITEGCVRGLFCN